MADELVLVDFPLPQVKRVTMNRPEKRNALFHPLRGAIMDALREGDLDDDIKVMIVRGNGPSFSAGYDLGGGNEGHEYPHFTAPGEGQWPRHVTDTWMSIWDLSKPVIAQVHGYCLAGGSELATGCDLVYMAEEITKIPLDVLRLNKRAIHRQMEAMGLRNGIRAGTELCALGTHTQTLARFVADIQSDGLTGALDRRDSKFGDYRTTGGGGSGYG